VTRKIRILIVDDHPVVRSGIRALLATETDMTVIGEASTEEEAVALSAELDPDLILMDLILGSGRGDRAIAEIRKNQPTRILVLTSFATEPLLLAAIAAGARGYLLKGSSPNELIQAIRSVHKGESWLPPGVTGKVLDHLAGGLSGSAVSEHLTERELDVLRLVAEGCSNHEISSRLKVSEQTVRGHVSNILRKLGLESRTQAALYALRTGIQTLD